MSGVNEAAADRQAVRDGCLVKALEKEFAPAPDFIAGLTVHAGRAVKISEEGGFMCAQPEPANPLVTLVLFIAHVVAIGAVLVPVLQLAVHFWPDQLAWIAQ
jgi:hypothetical protein